MEDIKKKMLSQYVNQYSQQPIILLMIFQQMYTAKKAQGFRWEMFDTLVMEQYYHHVQLKG